jgi:hypothetical protein
MAKKSAAAKSKSFSKSRATSKSKIAGKSPKGRSAVKPTGVKTKARILKTRVAQSGKTSRIKGHVSATNRKNQAKNDQTKKDLTQKELAQKDLVQRDQTPQTSRSKESGKSLPLPRAPRTSNMNIEVSAKGGSSAEFVADVSASIEKSLARYSERITRIAVHFEDVNGPKGGVDHQCRLEARLAGMQPVNVSDSGMETVQALKGALSKLDRLLSSTLGKMKVVKGKTSASGLPT